MNAVWIVDDDQSIRWVLEKALGRAGIAARGFESADQALQALAESRPSVLVTDLRMPGTDGLALLDRIRALQPDLPVIVMTAFTDLDSTVSAFRGGAFDYLSKPFDLNAAVALIERAMGEAARGAAGAPVAASNPAGGRRLLMQSSSPAMQEVFRAIGRLASSNATVLITGESGTGKELIARALHQHSARAEGPFVALNAAAIPKDLLEAELFGHEKGAFTGATQLRRGRFEEARLGTLFLDEIGDMPFDLQTRLLRVLAEGSFYRVGGSDPIRADVRIVAATHQPLEQRVAEGRFREDLFHRLNVIRLRLPPLRERRDDIPALAAAFLEDSARELKVPPRRLTRDAMRRLEAFDYPGNIRQLENFCQWLTVMAPSRWIQPKDLPPEIGMDAGSAAGTATRPQADSEARDQGASAAAETPGWQHALAQEVRRRLARNEPAILATLSREFETILISQALQHSRGRRAEAANRLGMGRNTLTRKCLELGLDEAVDN